MSTEQDCQLITGMTREKYWNSTVFTFKSDDEIVKDILEAPMKDEHSKNGKPNPTTIVKHEDAVTLFY